MARVRGKDVVLDMMDAVARLETIAEEHAAQFETFSAHMETLTAHMETLTAQVGTLGRSARASQQQFGRVARLLVELANDHQRIVGLEGRVEKLERKAG